MKRLPNLQNPLEWLWLLLMAALAVCVVRRGLRL